MTTAAVLEYSPVLIAKIHLLFSLWPLVLLSLRESVYLADNHLAEIQRAMHF